MGLCRCCCYIFITIVIVLCISGGLFAGFFPYPSHASCKVSWNIDESCSSTQQKVVEIMTKWSSDDCTGHECGYTVDNVSSDEIHGKKVSPIVHFSDTLNLTFSSSNIGCNITGYSKSDLWFAVIDFGYNYCNLKNLIVGADLDENTKFMEKSSNAECTMYSLAYFCLI